MALRVGAGGADGADAVGVGSSSLGSSFRGSFPPGLVVSSSPLTATPTPAAAPAAAAAIPVIAPVLSPPPPPAALPAAPPPVPVPPAAACAAVAKFVCTIVAVAVCPSSATLIVSSTAPLAIGFTLTAACPTAFVVVATCCTPAFSVAVPPSPRRNRMEAPDTGRSLRSRTSIRAGTAVPCSMMLTLPSPSRMTIRSAGASGCAALLTLPVPMISAVAIAAVVAARRSRSRVPYPCSSISIARVLCLVIPSSRRVFRSRPRFRLAACSLLILLPGFCRASLGPLSAAADGVAVHGRVGTRRSLSGVALSRRPAFRRPARPLLGLGCSIARSCFLIPSRLRGPRFSCAPSAARAVLRRCCRMSCRFL